MEEKTAINNHGIRIRICCASCKFKEYGSSGRMCSIRRSRVDSSDFCQSWVMSDGLCEAGKGGGRVKRLEYMLHALDRSLEDALMEKMARVTGQPYIPDAKADGGWHDRGSIYVL